MPHRYSTLPAMRGAGRYSSADAPAVARSSHALRWSLLALFIVAWLALPAIRTLVPPDEGRYAEMAREMLASGDWITPRLNGIKYFEKPPLQTWMNALTFAAVGIGQWQARLWTALCGLLALFASAYAARRVFGAHIGLYTALILGSSLFWVACGQVNSLDMSVSAMMTLALACLLIAQRDEAGVRERRGSMLACWSFMALAVLAKGPIGVVLPAGALLLYALAARDWRIWSRLHWPLGLPLFLAIAAPWFILVALQNPEQPRFFFIHEHVERFLLNGHRREAPWYYYLGILIVGILPWLGMLPHSLAAAVRPAAGRFQPSRLLLAWVVFILIFFSVSRSKLPGYILPVFPALAMLMAVHWERATGRARGAAAALAALVGAAGLALVPSLGKRSLRFPDELAALLAWQPWLAAAACVLLAGALFAFLQLRRRDGQRAILAIAGAGFLATQLILAGFEPYGRARAGLELVPAIAAQLQPDTKIYSVGSYQQSLSFYLRRTVILVDYTDEFAFGLQLQPELGLSLAAFSTQWTRDAAAGVRDLAIVEPPMLEILRRQGLPMRIVAHDARRTVLANR